MTTAQMLRQRINAAPDAETLRRMETLVTRHYDNGTITATELSRLDVRIMERLAILAA